MTSHSYEIAYWVPSQAVLDDQISISEPCLELMKTKTPLPILTGVSVEDKLFFVVVAWDKTETHKAVAESPDFPKILKAFAPLFPDPRPPSGITMVHAHFAPGRDPLPILGAPLTAVTYLVPKEGVSKEELGKALDGVCEAAKVKVVEKGLGFGVTWARIEERDREEGWQLLIVSGWKTMQDHIDFGSSDPAVAEMQSKLQLDKCITAHIPFAKRQWI